MTTGPADNAADVLAALETLQGSSECFLVRAYSAFTEAPSDGTRITPRDASGYVRGGRLLDLVLVYRSPSGDLDGWCKFVRAMVERFRYTAAKIQITEEPDMARPGLDGSFPRIEEAVVAGVLAARERAEELQLGALQIGFNVVGDIRSFDDFWSKLGKLGGVRFARAVDFVGLDTYPGVFGGDAAVSTDEIAARVVSALELLRMRAMPLAHLEPDVPLHVTEHGWPTVGERACERQREVIEAVVEAVHGCRSRLGVQAYELFQLRDACSADRSPLSQLGIMRDDYRPKPAFESYRKLVAELRQ